MPKRKAASPRKPVLPRRSGGGGSKKGAYKPGGVRKAPVKRRKPS